MRALDSFRRAVRALAKGRQAQTVLAAEDVPRLPVERVQNLIVGARSRANRLRSGIPSQPRPAPRQETVSRRLHAPHSPPGGCPMTLVSAFTRLPRKPHAEKELA